MNDNDRELCEALRNSDHPNYREVAEQAAERIEALTRSPNTLTVGDLIKELQKHDTDRPVFVYDEGQPESIGLISIDEGEEDGGVFVDTACDGVYSGAERPVVQIRVSIPT